MKKYGDDTGFISFLRSQKSRNWISGDLALDFISDKKSKKIKTYNDLELYLKNGSVSKDVMNALEEAYKEYELFIQNKSKMSENEHKNAIEKLNVIIKKYNELNFFYNKKHPVTRKLDEKVIISLNRIEQEMKLLLADMQDILYEDYGSAYETIMEEIHGKSIAKESKRNDRRAAR